MTTPDFPERGESGTTPPNIARMAHELRAMTVGGRQGSEQEIEKYLLGEVGHADPETRLNVLEELAREFSGSPAPYVAVTGDARPSEIHRLVSRFLGVSGEADRMSPQVLADTFAGSLDALFDSVNQIVSVINVTLLGESQELETIRKVIGTNLQGDTDYAAIRGYLDRIRKAFLVAHTSFQSSAVAVIDDILGELDPKAIESSKPPSGLKIGPLRKAELFELYEERFARCRRWFDSDQCREKLLREFEKRCQQLFTPSSR